MGILQKAGQFMGIDKFGQGLASSSRVLSGQVNKDIEAQQSISSNVQKLNYAAKQETDPVKKKRLLQLAQSFGTGTDATQIDPGLNLSNKEILGSAANVALNVATPGAFKGSKTAILGKNVLLGSGFGAASGLEKNRDLKGVIGSTVGGGVIGGAIGLTGLAAKAAKNFLGEKIPVWMMNKAVKPALQDLKKNVKFGTKTLGEELLNEGVRGGPKKLLEIADTKLSSLEDELQGLLVNSDKQITKKQILPYLSDLISTKRGIPGLKGDAQRIESIWNDLPETMTLQEANVMKRRIYSELRDVSYKLDAKLSSKAGALKQVAKGLKSEIEEAVGGTAVKDINKKLSIYGRLENSMVDQLAREMRNNGVGLTDAILLAGGGPTSILALLRHLGEYAETHVAQGLSKISKIGTGVTGKTIKAGLKRGALNLP